ncbi:hypothetical protein COV82_04570 [Candidatus Peregrinibacteria bacterium CG11_big_fil_rev_8_21_14_0_20_46_8]|nr:MAG: hypothetical protein COV82_04570 [Candidatus Peregrinibacteria bacterium CG11_big_fil_rev_8_21_14_0_20_46_8]
MHAPDYSPEAATFDYEYLLGLLKGQEQAEYSIENDPKHGTVYFSLHMQEGDNIFLKTTKLHPGTLNSPTDRDCIDFTISPDGKLATARHYTENPMPADPREPIGPRHNYETAHNTSEFFLEKMLELLRSVAKI